jgi:hypothetical protein
LAIVLTDEPDYWEPRVLGDVLRRPDAAARGPDSRGLLRLARWDREGGHRSARSDIAWQLHLPLARLFAHWTPGLPLPRPCRGARQKRGSHSRTNLGVAALLIEHPAKIIPSLDADWVSCDGGAKDGFGRRQIMPTQKAEADLDVAPYGAHGQQDGGRQLPVG